MNFFKRETAANFALLFVGLDFLYRSFESSKWMHSLWCPQAILLFTFVSSCVACIFGRTFFKEIHKSEKLRSALRILHAFDGFTALLLGTSIYYKNTIGFIVAVLCMSKFFLLYLFNRMITAVKAEDLYTEVNHTTRAFLHHFGSFLFIEDPKTIILTSLWRCVSMMGHALLSLRGVVANETYYQLEWISTVSRIFMNLYIFVLCIMIYDIRKGFTESATGHISYMVIRFGAKFKVGLTFEGQAKERWMKMNDVERLACLAAGNHIWLSFELVVLAMTIVYFIACKIYFLFFVIN